METRTRVVRRRLAAIVSLDVAGYVRLMGRDETGTLERLKGHRAELVDPAIATHGGRIVKTMGDGLLLEFPSVVAAVECTVAVQEGMAERTRGLADEEAICFRAGIHLGDIVVDGEDIHGDGVHIAVRLQEIATPGDILISAAVREQIGDRIDATFADAGERALKHITRPQHVFRWHGRRTVRTLRETSGIAAGTPSGVPVISIQPFEISPSDSDARSLADGLSDAIVTLLSRRTGIRVLPRGLISPVSSAPDLKRLTADSNADYLVLGRIRLVGERCRVNARMIVGSSGETFWSEQYDCVASDPFTLEDELARQIDAALRLQINAFDARRLEGRAEGGLSDADMLAKAAQLLYQMTGEAYREANDIIDSLLKRSPRDAMALAMRGYCGAARIQFGMTPACNDQPEELLKLARAAVSIDPSSDFAYFTRGLVQLHLFGEHEGAIADARQSLTVNPNFTFGLQLLGEALCLAGAPDEGLPHLRAAIEVNPRDPVNAWRQWCMAIGHFVAGETEEAIECAEMAVRGRGDAQLFWLGLAAMAAEAGNMEKARAAVQSARHGHPVESLRKLSLPAFKRAEDRGRYAAALRAAGVPLPTTTG